MFGRRKAQGFTLIEMILVIAIMTIATAIAGPIVSDMRSNARMQSAAAEFAAGIKRARGEALTRSLNVQLQVVLPADGANRWASSGWIVRDMKGAGSDIFRAPPAPTGVVVNALAPNSAADALVFMTNGMVQNTAGLPMDYIFRVCDSATKREVGRDVVVNRFGRVVIRNHANAAVCNP